MIQFPYEPARIIAHNGKQAELIYRPIALIRVIGPAGQRDLTGLVDTGADATLIPATFASLLGIPLNDNDKEDILGLGGSSTTIWYAQVNLEVLTPGGGPRWSARVGFYLGSKPILGHAGFLDHFTARFNGRAKTLTLTPNGTAPPSE